MKGKGDKSCYNPHGDDFPTDNVSSFTFLSFLSFRLYLCCLYLRASKRPENWPSIFSACILCKKILMRNLLKSHISINSEFFLPFRNSWFLYDSANWTIYEILFCCFLLCVLIKLILLLETNSNDIFIYKYTYFLQNNTKKVRLSGSGKFKCIFKTVQTCEIVKLYKPYSVKLCDTNM